MRDADADAGPGFVPAQPGGGEAAGEAAAGELLLEDRHPESSRHAVLDVDGRCAWLFLTGPDSYRIEKDAFAFSPGLMVPVDDAIRAARDGRPPPLSPDYASPRAVIENPRAEDFAFRWARNGESVAVLYRDEPFAMIVAGEPRGYSRALGREGFYGHPWDARVYYEAFND